MSGLLALAAGCSREADLAEGELGRVGRVSDGDLLWLESGLKVRLVEVEAPAQGYNGRIDEPWAKEAGLLLRNAALGRQARLWYGGLSRDSYGRALAHVIATDETGGDVWLNGLMARQGGARVRTYPDNARRARKLLAFEAEARAAKCGLWAEDHWRVRALDDLEGAPNYAIVEGALASIGAIPGEGEAHLTPGGIAFNIGEKLGKLDMGELKTGARIRLRGRIDTRSGEPVMRVSHWAQVEVV